MPVRFTSPKREINHRRHIKKKIDFMLNSTKFGAFNDGCHTTFLLIIPEVIFFLKFFH